MEADNDASTWLQAVIAVGCVRVGTAFVNVTVGDAGGVVDDDTAVLMVQPDKIVNMTRHIDSLSSSRCAMIFSLLHQHLNALTYFTNWYESISN